jgi:hypothetical protein
MRGFKNCFSSDAFQVIKSSISYTLHVYHMKEIGNTYKISLSKNRQPRISIHRWVDNIKMRIWEICFELAQDTVQWCAFVTAKVNSGLQNKETIYQLNNYHLLKVR